jgi:hypothetical protein
MVGGGFGFSHESTSMSELEFRRLIPLAAAASLVTVGCGSSTEKAAKATCEQIQECSEDAFDEAFDSIGECTDYYEEFLDDARDAIRDEEGGACANAFIDLLQCTAENSTCDTYDYDPIIDNCSDDIDSYIDHCL